MFNHQKITYFKKQPLSSFLWSKCSLHKRQITTSHCAVRSGCFPSRWPSYVYPSLSPPLLPGHLARLLSPSSCFFSPFGTLSTFLLPGLCQVRSWSNTVTLGNWRWAEQYCPFAAGSWEQEEGRQWPALQHWQQGRDASSRAGMLPGVLLGQLWLCIARPLQEWGNFTDIPDKHFHFIL